MVEEDHEGDDEEFLLKHKHCKIQQKFSHTSTIVAINNLATLTPWSYGIQNGMQPKYHAQLGKLEIVQGHHEHTKNHHNITNHLET